MNACNASCACCQPLAPQRNCKSFERIEGFQIAALSKFELPKIFGEGIFGKVDSKLRWDESCSQSGLENRLRFWQGFIGRNFGD